MIKFSFFLLGLVASAGTVLAQDTTRVEEGVRIGVDYRPGMRPGLVVVPGTGLDSVRAMVRRDLDYTDRFEMITVADLPQGSASGRGSAEAAAGVNYELYRSLGAQFAVELVPASSGVTARLHDLGEAKMQSQKSVTLPATTAVDFRLEVHRLSDESGALGQREPGSRGQPPDVRVGRSGISGRQRRAGHRSADAGRPDLALSGLVARWPAPGFHPDG